MDDSPADVLHIVCLVEDDDSILEMHVRHVANDRIYNHTSNRLLFRILRQLTTVRIAHEITLTIRVTANKPLSYF